MSELTPVDTNQVLLEVGPLASAANDTSVFASQLNNDANLVASRVQIHSRTHNATCFKYSRNKTQCRFNFPHPMIPNSHIDDTDSISLRRNNVWVNPWNLALASILRSNHNVTFVVSSNNALALIHYITNYTTRDNCSQYQRIMGAALVKKAYDNMQPSANVSSHVAPDKFALRAFNRLAYNQKIGGPLVASYLLRLPDHYTLSDNVKSINLAILRKRFPEFALHIYKPRSNVDDFVRLQRQISAPPIIFDHYCCRGVRLQKFCLFVYMRIVSIYPQKLANSSDIEFEPSHPKYQTHIQRHFTKLGSPAEVKLLGPLFDSDDLDDIILADDPGTAEGHNDIAVILLVLFIPWDRLQLLFADMGATDDNYSSFCWAIWYLCYPTLEDHVKYYAINILQMRKSKIDTYELTARNDHTGDSEKNVMEQDDPLEPSNAAVNDEDKQFFEIGLETNATIENLATLTIYNWRSADATDSLTFPATSHMWNSIRYTNDNGKSSALHRHLLQSNSDSGNI